MYARLIFGTWCILFRAPAHTCGHPKKTANPVPHTAKAGIRRAYNLEYVVIALIDVIDVDHVGIHALYATWLRKIAPLK